MPLDIGPINGTNNAFFKTLLKEGIRDCPERTCIIGDSVHECRGLREHRLWVNNVPKYRSPRENTLQVGEDTVSGYEDEIMSFHCDVGMYV